MGGLVTCACSPQPSLWIVVKEKAYVYICPACKGNVASDVKTGQINHRTVCGNQFSVKDGVVKEKGGKRQAWTPRGSHWSGFGAHFDACTGWQTAGLDAHKKPLMWPWGACWLRTPGERQAGPPRRSDGSGLAVALAPPRRSDGSGLGIACACAVGRSETLLQVLPVLSVLGVLGVLSV